MECHPGIPIIDFQNCSQDIDHTHDDIFKETGQAICKAFHEVGFVYLKNHGIEQKKIDETFHLFKRFAELPEDVKRDHARKLNGHGWAAMACEILNQDRPHDLKESFSYLAHYAAGSLNPNQEIAGFGDSIAEMFDLSYQLAMRVLKAVGAGLHLEVHRVVLPADEAARQKARQSIAFFAIPDDDWQIVPLQTGDHDTTTEPIKTRDYMDMKIKANLKF